MKLTYRGTQYNAASASLSAAYTNLTATYRGMTYSVPQANPVVTVPTQTLRYRGIVIGRPESDFHPPFRPANA